MVYMMLLDALNIKINNGLNTLITLLMCVFIISIMLYLLKGIRKLQRENEKLIREINLLHEKYLYEEEKYKKLDNIKNDFLSLISHELRTPLTSILGFTKIIRKKFLKFIVPELEKNEFLDEKIYYNKELIKVNLDIIITEAERLSSMIENILDITKIESGNEMLRRESLVIGQTIVKGILATYSLAQEKEIEVEEDIEVGIQNVWGDEEKILQIIINLISNSLKFTPIGGKINVKAKQLNDEFIEVSVIDNGVGIDEKYLGVIFEKFKQVENGDGNKPKGTGLGLYISRNLVELQGGTIGVTSQEGKGSRFYFTLPIYKGDALGNESISS